MKACIACGQDNVPEARFCHACGRSLEGDEQSDETRKTVTVVFTDLVDSTVLGESLDPESLRAVMGRYFDAMSVPLARHGGTIEKFIGDAIVAIFGIPTLREDDALRAIRASLEMRDALERLNDDLDHRWGIRLATRTGVNTGEVLAGHASHGTSGVVSDTVNVAARLQQEAARGEILIGGATHRLVRDSVVVGDPRRLEVKGKSEPLEARSLLDVVPDAVAIPRRASSTLVGRDREVGVVLQLLDRLATERACHLLTILGAAGVGKSRLVRELESAARGRARFLSGRCLPYGEGITFWPIAELVRDAAGLHEHDSPDDAIRKIEAVLRPGTDVAVAKLIAQVIGVGEVIAGPEQASWAVRTLLESLAGERPVVAVFDDIHWGEPAFLDLVEEIADWTKDVPLLIVCVARPELLDERPGWGGGKLNATSMLLEPLDPDACHSLIEDFLGASADEQIRDLVVSASEGNPLFAEEMLAMMIEEGTLAREGERWIARDEATVAVPASIQALIAARLDRLTEGERAAVQAAAVIGQVFPRGALPELVPERFRTDLSRDITSLARKDLVRRDAETFAGDEVLRFRHILVRDAAYRSASKQRRSELHDRYARWLLAAIGDRTGGYEEIVGYHLEQACLLRGELGGAGPEEDAARAEAARWLSSAGRRSFARSDAPAAVNLLGRADALIAADDAARLEILPDLIHAVTENGQFVRAKRLLDEAVAALRRAPSRRAEARVATVSLGYRMHTDARVAVEETLREIAPVIQLHRREGDHLEEARAWGLVATAHWTLCRAGPMTEAIEHSLRAAERAGDRRAVAQGIAGLVRAILAGPTPVSEGLGRLDAIMERAGDDLRVRSRVDLARGVFEAMRGNFEVGRELVERGRAIMLELGLRMFVAGVGVWASYVEQLAGNNDVAEAVVRETYESLKEMGATSFASTHAAVLGILLADRGEYEEAERYALEGMATAASDDVVSQMTARGVLARVLAARGDAPGARRLASEATSLAAPTDFLDIIAGVQMDVGLALAIIGDRDAAAESFRSAQSNFTRKGNVVSARRVARYLDEVALA